MEEKTTNKYLMDRVVLREKWTVLKDICSWSVEHGQKYFRQLHSNVVLNLGIKKHFSKSLAANSSSPVMMVILRFHKIFKPKKYMWNGADGDMGCNVWPQSMDVMRDARVYVMQNAPKYDYVWSMTLTRGYFIAGRRNVLAHGKYAGAKCFPSDDDDVRKNSIWKPEK